MDLRFYDVSMQVPKYIILVNDVDNGKGYMGGAWGIKGIFVPLNFIANLKLP